jgi:crotonobetainyl-CoA:carnitine CoA-transferase CaiB-like acyl-CoA transferase
MASASPNEGWEAPTESKTQAGHPAGATNPVGTSRPRPPLGNATFEVMRELLELTADEIGRLRQQRII